MLRYLLITQALAGYGDPIQGIPTPAERELHLWTNAVRVDPSAFADLYPCAFDTFSEFEQSSQNPLLWHDGLGQAARDHSDDMYASGNFSHDSSDGTSFFERVLDYYPSEYVGENIAYGYADPFETVIEGWMCSSGHRENIMWPDYVELGTGIVQVYYTQDFGARTVNMSRHPLVMGAHSPTRPTTVASLYTVFQDESGESPRRIQAIVNGEPTNLDWLYGTESQGVYGIEWTVTAPCTVYAFEAELADGSTARFPATGHYGFGMCSFTDSESGWIEHSGSQSDDTDLGLGLGGSMSATNESLSREGRDEDRSAGACGCQQSMSPPWSVAALWTLWLLAARRERPSC